MKIYGDFDQAALDAQYNLRAAVPEHGDFFARWARESAAVRQAHDCRLDLRYGSGLRATLDLFRAANPGAPSLVFIHGGYWQAMDKSDFSFIAPSFLAAGIAVALINYPLAPAA